LSDKQTHSVKLRGADKALAKLEARGVSADYVVQRTGARLPVLRDINVDIEAGEFVSILGPSGCGKTTFLNAIDGSHPLRKGSIRLDGKDIGPPGRDRAVVFQSPSLLPWRTVRDNIIYGLELQGRKNDPKAKETVAQLIKMVSLSGFERSYPAELSGGMQQRVNLARALAVDPELLLLDEPFAALDAQTREFMQSELLRIWQSNRKTAIFITHQIDEAIYLSDRVLVFSARPATVRESITIDLPRPRPLQIKREAPFHAYAERIWNLIYEETRRQGLDEPTGETL
jgi:NitT/TauT family transport system ATP-binding protein